MEITEAVVYKTEDGKTFATEAEAKLHTTYLRNEKAIDEFIDKHFPHKESSRRRSPHTASARRAIMLWIAEHS